MNQSAPKISSKKKVSELFFKYIQIKKTLLIRTLAVQYKYSQLNKYWSVKFNFNLFRYEFVYIKKKSKIYFFRDTFMINVHLSNYSHIYSYVHRLNENINETLLANMSMKSIIKFKTSIDQNSAYILHIWWTN